MPRRIKDLSNRIKHKITPAHVTLKSLKESSSLSSSSNQKNAAEPKNLQVIKAKLAQNALVELRLGFDEVEFYSKRDVQSLIRVLEEQFLYRLTVDKHSCLRSIQIGWKLPSFAVGPIFQQVIPLLLQDPIRITHIQLALGNTPILESCLKRIVSWPTLESLDLRSLQVMRPLAQSERLPPPAAAATTHHHSHKCSASITSTTAALSPAASRTTNYHRAGTNSSSSSSSNSPLDGGVDFSPHCWKSENAVRIIPYVSLSVKTLKLIDCGLRSHHIAELCSIIRRRQMHGLHELSLRHNRDLDGGFSHLLALPCIKKLDLSLCDLDPHDGICIARAMEEHLQCGSASNPGGGGGGHNSNHHLQKLSLAGNYRMAESMPDIVQAAICRLVELDCSFCDVQSKLQRKVFTILATTPQSTLQSFVMQGTRINSVNELLACIENNTSLRRLALDHPREPFLISAAVMERIAKAIPQNFSLCTLMLDTYKRELLWRDMEFWLELNRCGRCVLLQSNEQRVAAWPTVLANAAQKDDPNVLYWLLKHGAVMFACD